jgi:hypothetical protein
MPRHIHGDLLLRRLAHRYNPAAEPDIDHDAQESINLLLRKIDEQVAKLPLVPALRLLQDGESADENEN